jgi:acetylornithine deacetylase/succinyl-diaminopimelate desuccinylase-like protein
MNQTIGGIPMALLSAIFHVVICATVFAAEPVSRRPAEEEAIALLRHYIQIDTTNPPGNEIKAAQFFKEIFNREGIETKIIESAQGRANIYARLRSAGAKKAIVLLNHMDVVPADAKLWKEPPFSGVSKDGYIWGRGALDMKGPAIVELMSLISMKRQGVPLKADIIFLGTADEEAGGALGAGFLMEKHPELFEGVGLVLNEGGGIRLGGDGRARYYTVGVAEKTPLWLRLTATGAPGHGSTPRAELAVNKLVLALNRLIQYQTPVKVLPEVQKFYAAAAVLESGARRSQFADLQAALKDPLFAAEFLKEPRHSASVRNTVAITGIKGSNKVNVIPAQASANIDVRLLPGEDPTAFIDGLRKVIGDESIKVEVLLSFPPATSPPHAEAIRAITELARRHDGNIPVLAPLGRGFTDCHFFREKGVPCYGFIPMRGTDGGESLVHGIDERVSVENFQWAIRAMLEMVQKLVAE